jgi:hypothetical protein
VDGAALAVLVVRDAVGCPTVTDTSSQKRLAWTLPRVRLEPIDGARTLVRIDQPRRLAALRPADGTAVNPR